MAAVPIFSGPNGALTSDAGSVVTLTNGASACDVFWTPAQATTLGANTVFAGTDIDDSGITIGANTSWTGRALAFGGTITTDTDTITVPMSCGATTLSSAESAKIAITVICPPTAPTNLIISSTSYSEIDLNWTDNSNNEDGFVIEEAQGTDSLFTPIDSVPANVTSYSRTGLLPDTAYFYRVEAYNGAGSSAFTNEASSTTQSLPSSGCVPGATEACVSGANSCSMTNSGTQTCTNAYVWGACNASVPPNSACPGNSGGGGGGGFTMPPPAPVQANVTIAGSAYPLSKVTVLQDAQIVAQSIAGPDGNFTITINNLSGGNYIFSVYASDNNGNRSALFTFPVYLTVGASTEIGGVFLSPTIATDKQEVKQGDPIVIFGQSVPNASVRSMFIPPK